MKYLDFFKKGFLLFIIFAIFLILISQLSMIDNAMAAWSGLIIGFLNFLAGSASVSLGIRKSDKDFYSYFFGGMILRFALIFVALFLLIRFFNMNKIILVSSLLTTYVGFMIIEVWLIYKFSASQGKGE